MVSSRPEDWLFLNDVRPPVVEEDWVVLAFITWDSMIGGKVRSSFGTRALEPFSVRPFRPFVLTELEDLADILTFTLLVLVVVAILLLLALVILLILFELLALESFDFSMLFAVELPVGFRLLVCSFDPFKDEFKEGSSNSGT